VTSTLARLSSAQRAHKERRYAAQLHDYFWPQEEDDKCQRAAQRTRRAVQACDQLASPRRAVLAWAGYESAVCEPSAWRIARPVPPHSIVAYP
jgi:hypothetical protein